MLRGFFSICNSIISDDFGNYDAIILENFSTTFLLGLSMLVMLTPPLQGFLVSPEGEVVGRFEPKVEPGSDELTGAIEAQLP